MKSILKVAARRFGNFEQHSTIPPRYFMVTYEINAKEYTKQVDDNGGARAPLWQEHTNKIADAVKSRRILFRGEVPLTSDNDEEGLAVVKHPKEIFFLYHGRDEREPHSFIKHDSLYQAGIVS